MNKNEVVSITLKIEGDQAKNQLSILEKEARDLEKAIKEVPRGGKDWADLNKQLNANTEEQKKLRTEIGLTGLTYKQLQSEAKSLYQELNGMTAGTEAFAEKSKRLQEVEARMSEVKKEMKGITSELDKPGLWDRVKGYIVGAFSVITIQGAITSLWNFAKASVDVAAKYSDAFGDIMKTTGMGADEVQRLNSEIKKIDTRTAQASLLEIAKVGGQIGVANTEMLGFVKSVDMAVVALGDEFTGGAEEVATQMGILSKLFRETKELEAGTAINQIGSAINELGSAGTATGPVITDFTTRVGQLGKMAPSIAQTMGLGAVFQEMGLTAEIAASGLSKIILVANDNMDKFSKQMGMATAEVKNLLDTNPNEFILKLSESFKGLSNTQIAERLKALKLNTQESIKVMQVLAENTDMVKNKQELASKAMKEGTSLANEFNIKNTTAAAEMAKVGKVMENLRQELGERLIPAVVLGTAGFIAFINVIRAIPAFIAENKELFIGLGVALVSLNAANIAAAASALYHTGIEKGRVIATQAVTVAQTLLNTAMKANPMGILIAGISLIVAGFAGLYNRSEELRAKMFGLWEAVKAVGTILADFGKAAVNLDFNKMSEILSNGGKKVADAFNKGYNEKMAAERMAAMDKYDQEMKAKAGKATAGATNIAEIEKLINENKNRVIGEQDDKALKQKEKNSNAAVKIEDDKRKEIAEANAKALELMQQMESEHDVIVAHNSLQKEEEKIQEKKRKRLKEINESLADEEKKEAARVMINRSAEAETDRVREEFRKKKEAADQAAAEKRLADEKFILEQERQAHNALFDFQEIQHKNNAAKLAQIKKERLDVELKYTQDKLQAELLAEQTKAATSIQDLDLLAQTLNALEEKYNQQSLLAVAKTAEEKKKIDADLLQKKKENLENYSNAFSALLAGDVSGFVAAAGKIVQGQKSALAERLSADMAYYEAGAQAATQAVSFLNDLAQAKAEKAIALANKERDEKVAILENEIAVTEVLINNASEYAKNLKEAETARMAELQRILTDETSTEEQKRAALFAYYSQQHQQMKAAEEAKLTELHRLAAMAQTEEEKRAVEEKIRLAEQESAEKIRLSEEELEAKKNNIQDITDFSEESSQTMLADAEAASQKQLELADQEAVLKMEFKQDLEETIAAENRKARATETAEKKKAWEAQKKADIATALITGALAVLKALANFFPLNIILAASAAVLTGVQVAKIKNQASPAFAHGGFVPQGGYHGSSYGDGGIALIDRASGQEVGEMEGDEAIVSRKQTAANWPIIEKMFRNARTPGMENKPVAFAAGGFVSPYWQKDMYLFGSKKKKREAEAAAYQAEADAKAAQADADAYMGEVGFDASGVPTGDTSGGAEAADANASYAAAQKQGEMQIELLTSILESSDAVGETVAKVGDAVLAVKDAVNQVRAAVDESTSATRGVESAVRSNNNHSILYGIMDRISSLA